MPRPFDVSAETPATVEQIYSAFGDQQYWLARLAAYGGDTMTLDSLVVDDGGVAVATTQDLGHDLLPGPLAKVFPGNLKVLREEAWQLVDCEVRGETCITAFGAPASGAGTAVLAPTEQGTRLRFTGTVEIRIPLIGGTIEKLIRSQLAVEIPVVMQFTTTWIADHA
jgi:hypothetical protein